MSERVANENNLSDTSGNIYNIQKISLQINNRPDFVITEKMSTNIHV